MRQSLTLIAVLSACLLVPAGSALASTSASDDSLVSGEIKAEMAITATDASPMTLSYFSDPEATMQVTVTSTYPDWTVSIVDGEAEGASGPSAQAKTNPGYMNRQAGGRGPGSLKLPLKAAKDGDNLHPVNGSKRGIFSGEFNETHQVRVRQNLKRNKLGEDDAVLADDSYELVLAFSAVAN